jgi:long-chain acyl-CoA synthetase
MNVATNLERSALFFPDHPAISRDGNETTYARLDEQAGLIASALVESGIAPGDHFGLCAANSTDWLAFYFGVLKAGAVAVTLSGALTFDEMALLVGHSKPRMVFTDRAEEMARILGAGADGRVISPGTALDTAAFSRRAKGPVKALDRDRTDVAAILYTGGTTGTPKGVMLTHENINVSAHNVAYSERSTENDRALLFLPLNHVFGQMHITNATILSAGCLELIPSFNLDQVLAILKEGRVTKLFAVPTVFTRLLALPDLKERLGAVRYCFSAAASLPAEVIRRWKEVTGIDISEGYGMTESASAVTYNHYYRHVVASVGETVPGVEVQIRDLAGNLLPFGQEGEICIKGHNIMKGYLNNPEDTKAAFWPDGWYRSGDIGVLDEKGYLFIVDRLKDMIITGGENVYPREVEEAIYLMPEVQECAVVGAPDKDWGERVVAFIIPKEGRAIDAQAMKSFLKSRISAFKVPKDYMVVKELPKNAAGKILKRELRAAGPAGGPGEK